MCYASGAILALASVVGIIGSGGDSPRGVTEQGLVDDSHIGNFTIELPTTYNSTTSVGSMLLSNVGINLHSLKKRGLAAGTTLLAAGNFALPEAPDQINPAFLGTNNQTYRIALGLTGVSVDELVDVVFSSDKEGLIKRGSGRFVYYTWDKWDKAWAQPWLDDFYAGGENSDGNKACSEL